MCRGEGPHLSRLQEKYANQGLVVLGINSDNDPAHKVQEWADEKKIRHTLLLQGNTTAMRTFSCRRFPSKFWIDRSGTVREFEYGPKRTDQHEETLRSLLKRR